MSSTIIATYTGQGFDFANMNPDTVRFEDIAHALSQASRYTGHTKRWYSVAEHAVRCADYLRAIDAPLEVQRAGLHHDDSEAYTGDMNKPLKTLLPDFQDIEKRISATVYEGLGLTDLPFDDPRVKEADLWMLGYERSILLRDGGAAWQDPAHKPYSRDNHPAKFIIPQLGWEPFQARSIYRNRSRGLGEHLS